MNCFQTCDALLERRGICGHGLLVNLKQYTQLLKYPQEQKVQRSYFKSKTRVLEIEFLCLTLAANSPRIRLSSLINCQSSVNNYMHLALSFLKKFCLVLFHVSVSQVEEQRSPPHNIPFKYSSLHDVYTCGRSVHISIQLLYIYLHFTCSISAGMTGRSAKLNYPVISRTTSLAISRTCPAELSPTSCTLWLGSSADCRRCFVTSTCAVLTFINFQYRMNGSK